MDGNLLVLWVAKNLLIPGWGSINIVRLHDGPISAIYIGAQDVYDSDIRGCSSPQYEKV